MATHRTDNASQADWYVCLTYGRNVPGGTETDYSDGYFIGDKPHARDYRDMVPEGFRQIGPAEIKNTHNPYPKPTGEGVDLGNICDWL